MESCGSCTQALLPNYSGLKLAELKIHKLDLDIRMKDVAIIYTVC